MFQPFKNFLSDSIKRGKISRQIEASMVCNKFDHIIMDKFGDQINSVKPLYLKNKVLTISVSNSVLAQELQLVQEEIIKQINTYFKKEIAKQLRFLI